MKTRILLWVALSFFGLTTASAQKQESRVCRRRQLRTVQSAHRKSSLQRKRRKER